MTDLFGNLWKKTHPKIYLEFLKRLKLSAEEYVFIDDNLLSAKELGFKTILFENSTKLKEELKKLGIHFR